MSNKKGSVRIIGGAHRGRRIFFPSDTQIRPSLDQVRETVFNWLQFDIAGCRCLDLFAGSGAFGLEALSRGAEYVCFIDRDRSACIALQDNIDRLGESDKTNVLHRHFNSQVPLKYGPFNRVFLDPPYDGHLLLSACDALQNNDCLESGTLVYIEVPRHFNFSDLPKSWECIKFKKSKRANYGLWRTE